MAQKTGFWPFNEQFLGIERINPLFLLARSGPTVAARLLVKSPQNVIDGLETRFLNYSTCNIDRYWVEADDDEVYL